VNELAMQYLHPIKLKGLIIAGSAGLKHELVLDPPLQSLVMKVPFSLVPLSICVREGRVKRRREKRREEGRQFNNSV